MRIKVNLFDSDIVNKEFVKHAALIGTACFYISNKISIKPIFYINNIHFMNYINAFIISVLKGFKAIKL